MNEERCILQWSWKRAGTKLRVMGKRGRGGVLVEREERQGRGSMLGLEVYRMDGWLWHIPVLGFGGWSMDEGVEGTGK